MPWVVYVVPAVIAVGLVALLLVLWRLDRREHEKPEPVDDYEAEMVVRDLRLWLRRVDPSDFEESDDYSKR